MKVTFKIHDDWILASETVEITFDRFLFNAYDLKKDNKYILSICKNIARLRGHTGRYIEIEILEMEAV